jgi:hypothetical protein
MLGDMPRGADQSYPITVNFIRLIAMTGYRRIEIINCCGTMLISIITIRLVQSGGVWRSRQVLPPSVRPVSATSATM